MANCKLLVGHVGNDKLGEFGLSRNGWGQAQHRAREVAGKPSSFSQRPIAMVDLKCDGGRIPLYQCEKDHQDGRVRCHIEDTRNMSGGEIAGLRGRRSRRRRKR